MSETTARSKKRLGGTQILCTKNSECLSNQYRLRSSGTKGFACSLGNGFEESDFGEKCQSDDDCTDGIYYGVCVCAGNKVGL
ncbi:26834_t:CDS:2 [Gigaspora margarita]|uniref:26834_t:CDS:1 n=1 Tax=Gigaspora margarita TaxID=4874 RepID=A0ABM8W4R0_GIGMA|nr:26834_t:CDS:2 [Gigaspora margarita]